MPDMFFFPTLPCSHIGTSAKLWWPMGDRDVIKWHTAFEKFLPCRLSFQTAIVTQTFKFTRHPFRLEDPPHLQTKMHVCRSSTEPITNRTNVRSAFCKSIRWWNWLRRTVHVHFSMTSPFHNYQADETKDSNCEVPRNFDSGQVASLDTSLHACS
jgi:hypothetical protein